MLKLLNEVCQKKFFLTKNWEILLSKVELIKFSLGFKNIY